MLVLKRWPRFPGPLVVLVGAALAVAVFDLEAHGIVVVGHVPSGFAVPELPPLHADQLVELLPAAFAITFVSILESLALARDYADSHDYEIETNQEISALGASNVAAGMFQGMVVTGAITRSSILEQAGARTQLSGALTGVIVAPLLVFGTALFRPIPIAVLSAIVIVAVIAFVDVREARRLWHVQRADFWIAMVAFVGTLGLGLQVGVLVAVALSVGLIVYRVTRPHFPELGRVPGTDSFLDLRRHPDAQRYPGTLILRIDSSLWFANADVLRTRLWEAETNPPNVQTPEIHTVVLDMSGVDYLDATADHMLRKIATRSARQGRRLLLVNVNDDVRQVMDASGGTALIGEDAFFTTDADAVADLDARLDAL
jgi:SulP family sulfate permease